MLKARISCWSFGGARRMYGAIVSRVALILFLSLTLIAGRRLRPWIEKDWTQWTSADCTYVLMYSPWVYSSHYEMASQNGAAALISRRTFVQIRSALPIRQALLRQAQIEKRYDKMSPQMKQAFDQEHFAELTEQSQILIYVQNLSLEPPPPQLSSRPDLVKGPETPRQLSLQMNDGTFVEPIRVTKVKPDIPTQINEFTNQYEYIFPRTIDDKFVLTSSDTTLEIRLGDPLVLDKKTGEVLLKDFRDYGLRFSFKLSDLKYKGKLEY